MTADVVALPGKGWSVEAALGCALKESDQIESTLILCRTKDGTYRYYSAGLTYEQVLWLLERHKIEVFKKALEP